MTRYFGSFSDYGDMISSWGKIPDDTVIPASDADVLFASYGCEGYEGDATVVFRSDGKLYHVSGSHCSCYGLSENGYIGSGTQWEPEEMPIEALAKMDPRYFNLDDNEPAIEAWKVMISNLQEQA